MELFFTFLVTVAAGVVCHLISKWLDRHDKGNQQPSGRFATIKRKEESPDCTPLRSGDSFFAYMEFSTFLCLSALQHMQMLIARYISFSQNKNSPRIYPSLVSIKIDKDKNRNRVGDSRWHGLKISAALSTTSQSAVHPLALCLDRIIR